MARVVVVGGGVAGIAAAVALADAGWQVTLAEKRATLGGRASSFSVKAVGQEVDNSQHVLMGCCTNQIDLYRRLGVLDRIEWHDAYELVGEDGRHGTFIAWPPLPPPLHLLPGLLRLPGLSLADRAMLGLAFGRMLLAARRLDALDGVSFTHWLGRTTTPTLDRTFWRMMLISVLNAQPHQVSARAAVHFFVTGLMAHRDSFRLGVPLDPLGALHHDAVVRHLGARGGEVRNRCAARVLPTAAGPRVWLGREPVACDAAVVAVRWGQLGRVLPPRVARSLAGGAVERLAGESIIGVNLWFDRPVVMPRLLGMMRHDVDWVFGCEGGRRISVVVSAAASWDGMSAEAMRDRALAATRALVPDVPEPVAWAACREGEATFVPAPGLNRHRPPSATPWPGLALAGAWTNTGWPATQESAARSGYAAADAVAGGSFVLPDLPRQGFTRWLAGPG